MLQDRRTAGPQDRSVAGPQVCRPAGPPSPISTFEAVRLSMSPRLELFKRVAGPQVCRAAVLQGCRVGSVDSIDSISGSQCCRIGLFWDCGKYPLQIRQALNHNAFALWQALNPAASASGQAFNVMLMLSIH